MAERRKVRMGIDVGGTHTKAVAIDNATHEIIGKNEVKTTHDHEQGVAAGVVQCFENCLRENNISPEDVVFVAHSTTQATNAFIEGDVAQVGVIGVAGGGLEGWLAKPQLNLKDIILDEKVGRKIKIHNQFIKKKQLNETTINTAIDTLKGEGSEVIVASMAFGVDGGGQEEEIHDCAEKKGMPVTMASDITKLYKRNGVLRACGRRYGSPDDHARRRRRYGNQRNAQTPHPDRNVRPRRFRYGLFDVPARFQRGIL